MGADFFRSDLYPDSVLDTGCCYALGTFAFCRPIGTNRVLKHSDLRSWNKKQVKRSLNSLHHGKSQSSSLQGKLSVPPRRCEISSNRHFDDGPSAFANW
jgi:hypothetical protein